MKTEKKKALSRLRLLINLTGMVAEEAEALEMLEKKATTKQINRVYRQYVKWAKEENMLPKPIAKLSP